MAYKRKLKYKRKKSLPLPEAIDKLTRRTADALTTGRIKASVSDLVRLVRLRNLFPVAFRGKPAVWIGDGR